MINCVPIVARGIKGATIYRFGGFRFDSTRRILERDGDLVPLAPKAADVLALLLENAGQVVAKDTLFRLVWPGTFVVDSSLTRNICVLRKTLDEAGSDASLITTVSKRGYLFAAAVETESFEDTPVESVPVEANSASRAAAVFQCLRANFRNRVVVVGAVLVLVFIGLGHQQVRRHSGEELLTEGERNYLVGRHLWQKIERSEIQKALERFQAAAAFDPKSALAHAGIADSYAVMTMLAVGSPAENLRKAREAASEAVRLAPSLAAPHVSLGFVRILADFDAAGAEREFKEALRLQSNLPSAYYGYACLLVHSGRISEARSQIRRAQVLDPVSPIIGVAAARVEYFDRRYQDAVAILRDVLDREPLFSQAHYYTAMSLGRLGDTEGALHHLRKARLNPALLASDEAWLRSLAGDREPARQLLADRREFIRKTRGKPTGLVLAAIDAGEYDAAIDSLEEMWKTREIELLSLKVDPRFDPLRADPRFTALVRKVWPNR